MSPHQQQLLIGSGVVLLGLILIAGLIIFVKSKWAVKKKVSGVLVFLLGFLSLAVAWGNLAPYFFSKNFVIGEVKSADCFGDIQRYSTRSHYPDCNYSIAYLLDNKEQTAKINSGSDTILLSQGQKVEVYYKKDNSGHYTIGIGKIGDSKSFGSYLSSHWYAFAFLLLSLLFFYSGFKLLGFISKKTDNEVNQALKDRF